MRLWEGKLRQNDVDWRWERTKSGEKLILTYIPTGQNIISEEVRISRRDDKAFVQRKKRQVYEDLFDRLEEVIYGPQPKGRQGIGAENT